MFKIRSNQISKYSFARTNETLSICECINDMSLSLIQLFLALFNWTHLICVNLLSSINLSSNYSNDCV